MITTMAADQCVDSEIVTKFLLNTCRLRHQPSLYTLQAVMEAAVLANQHPPDDEEVDHISLTTGSVAEFYIQPMLPLFGDIDIMYHLNAHLAVPRGHPPPTRLPVEFHYYVQVCEIISSHLPGYVYLENSYLLTHSIDNDTYNYTEYKNKNFVSHGFSVGAPIHGPAVLSDNKGTSILSTDSVHCLRCLSWPLQAADWPARQRNYGWPDSATVERVVGNGCDVVGVAHRQCRQDEWMSEHQWRLSFSRAENVLLNSWMSVQQIVYHMLRFFVKTEQLTESTNNSEASPVSNYHIKTLVLWASERKPRLWWAESFNLVRICVELLHTLSGWLTDRHCPHYFVNNGNLVHDSLSVDTVAIQLILIDESHLSAWFVTNYIGKCAQICPDYVCSMFYNAGTVNELQNAISAILEWNFDSLNDLWHAVVVAEFVFPVFISLTKFTVQSCVCWMNELAKINMRFHEYFTAFAFLHVAHRVSRNGFDENLLDILATIFGQFVKTPRYSMQQSSLLCLNKAAKLMKVAARETHSTERQIRIELSKAYLHRALRCKDSDSDSIYFLANVYLAVLYYTTGQYQTAIDHCTLVMRSQGHSQCSSHVVQGELLPKIDDNTDNVLGLAVLYQYVQSTQNQPRQREYVSVCTIEILAYYLYSRHLSVAKYRQVTQASVFDIGQRYAKGICEAQRLNITDVLCLKLLKNARKQNVTIDQPESRKWSSAVRNPATNTSDLVQLLQQSAVEHLTEFRRIEEQEFGAAAALNFVTTDFEALYAYKRGEYGKCLRLSERNVITLLNAVGKSRRRLDFNISMFPEFIQLMDDDIVSLTALTVIVNPKCRDGTNSFNDCVYITQLTMSLYLMTQCQPKLGHSLKSHIETLMYFKFAQRRIPSDWTLNQLVLKLAECKQNASRKSILNDRYNMS